MSDAQGPAARLSPGTQPGPSQAVAVLAETDVNATAMLAADLDMDTAVQPGLAAHAAPATIHDIVRHAAADADAATDAAIPGQPARGDTDAAEHPQSLQHQDGEIPAASVAAEQHSTAEKAPDGARTAAQYPWMRHSIEDAESLAKPQPHVTFGVNALASAAKLQSGKIPVSYIAAAAADKAASITLDDQVDRPHPMLPRPLVQLQTAQSHTCESQWDEQSRLGSLGTDATAARQKTEVRREGEAIHASQPQELVDKIGYAEQMESEHQGRRIVNDADSLPATDEEEGGADKSAAASAASYANSAASGLSHLMRAQEPWSSTSSSSHNDEALHDIGESHAQNVLASSSSSSSQPQIHVHDISQLHAESLVSQDSQQMSLPQKAASDTTQLLAQKSSLVNDQYASSQQPSVAALKEAAEYTSASSVTAPFEQLSTSTQCLLPTELEAGLSTHQLISNPGSAGDARDQVTPQAPVSPESQHDSQTEVSEEAAVAQELDDVQDVAGDTLASV